MPHFAAILLPSPVGHHYYSTFYLLAFLLNQALLLWEGHRRGYALRPWLLLTTGVTLAFIVGTKLIAMSGAEWTALWQHGEWPATTARSVLGGAIAGTITGQLLRRWLGFSAHVFDAFCLPLCAAYAVQCVGCLLTGCCFGHLTTAAWGVSYAPDTLPYLVQLQRGLIAPGAAHSLPVLPTQALTGLLCLGTGLLLWQLRHRAWAGGSWRLLQVLLLLLGRFVVEFGRDPAGEQVGAAVRIVAGLPLKQVQWVLLPLLVLTAAWWWRRSHRAALPELRPTNHTLRNLLGVAGMLAFAALLGPGALTLPELLVVKGGLTAVLVLEAVALLRHSAAQPQRLALPLGLASAVLLFTNQVPAPDSTSGRRYLSIGLGAQGGAYDEDVVEKGGCSSSPSRTAYYHRYAGYTGSVAYQQEGGSSFLRAAGVNVALGRERIGSQPLDINGPFLTQGATNFRTHRLWDVNPYLELAHWSPRHQRLSWGVRLGYHIGQLGYPSSRLRSENTLDSTATRFIPEVGVWLGNRQRLYSQLDFGRGQMAFGSYYTRLGMGSSFGGQTVDILAGLGANLFSASENTVGFLNAQVRLGQTGLVLQSSAATNFGRQYHFTGGLQYRLPLKTKGKP